MSRTRTTGSLLRLAGAALLAVAWLAGDRLFGGAPITAPGAIDALLALILFVSASAGSAMLVLGGHLFDRVAVSRRWAPIDPVTLNLFQGPPEGQDQAARWMLNQVQHDDA